MNFDKVLKKLLKENRKAKDNGIYKEGYIEGAIDIYNEEKT